MPGYCQGGRGRVASSKSAAKFNSEEYATLGFEESGEPQDGAMWPTWCAWKKFVTAADEARIAALVKKAVS